MVVIPTYGNYTDDDTVNLEHRPTVSARRYVILHIINSNAQYHAAITSHGTLNVILGIRHYPLHRLPYHLDRRQRHNDRENDYGYRFQLCPSYGDTLNKTSCQHSTHRGAQRGRLLTLCCLAIVWSNRKWTRTGPGTSVIWTWLNRTESGTRYTPVLDCYLSTS